MVALKKKLEIKGINISDNDSDNTALSPHSIDHPMILDEYTDSFIISVYSSKII